MTDLDIVHLPNGLNLSRLAQVHKHAGAEDADRPVGDCYRTAIACLLGCADPTEVPHFADIVEDLDVDCLGWEAHRLARQWLRAERELDLYTATLEWAVDLGRPYIAGVVSRRGPWNHVVIAEGTRVIWDPTGAALAAEGLLPYTWADVEAVDAAVDVLVLPYDPDPDEQIAQWRSQP